MREHEMRHRVQCFLQRRLRAMVMPATLGLGLSLGGCASDALSVDDGGADTDGGAADTQLVTKYMAQLPDAGPEDPYAHPEYMAQLPRQDAAPATRYMGQMPDTGRDLLTTAIYAAQLPRK